VLEDGRYDAFVISADEIARPNTRDDVDDDARHDDPVDVAPSMVLSLTIVAGAHKGDVVDVRMSRIGARDAIDIVGLPCTLIVENGAPRIVA
jgi:hypothetical protein